MLESMSRILGPERYDAHEALGVKTAIEQLFKKEGLVGTSLVITKSFDPRRQIDTYEVRTVSVSGGDTSGGMSRAALEDNIAPLDALIPADF